MDNLRTLKNIPITNKTIGGLFPELVGKNQKVRELEKLGEIIRLKRGLYVVSPQKSGVTISTELIANHLYGPSYVSMLSALRYYGLIPEMVYTMQSMTIKHSRSFENSLGRFQYLSCPVEYYGIGLTQVKSGSAQFIMASPEKALCDLIVNTHGLNLRYRRELLDCLENDFRLDMDAFEKMDPTIFRRCAEVGKKKVTLNLLANILER
ncbi:MAG: hypothetical protein IKX43_01985 [Paludibacteraceae bacterium]|nr:hypothetical protein [Paludibacteraceae bacterium]